MDDAPSPPAAVLGLAPVGNGAPKVGNPLAAGLAPQSSRAVTRTLPEAKWDATTRALVEAIEQHIYSEQKTPVFNLQLRAGHEQPMRYARYDHDGDIPGQSFVSELGPKNVLKLRMILPVSGHTGDSNGDGTPDSIDYAKRDKAIVWVAYVDQGTLEPGDDVSLDFKHLETPDPKNPKASGPDVRILAHGLKCPPGHLTRVIDVDIPMKPGKIAVVMYDGNGTDGGGDVAGFTAGRRHEFFWGP